MRVYVYDYTQAHVSEYDLKNIEDTFLFRDNDNFSWINIDGIRKADIEAICQHFEVHLCWCKTS